MVKDRLINKLFYMLWDFDHMRILQRDVIGKSSPLFIAGMFRSGTSLLTNLLIRAGYDAGPDNHLLKAMGRRGQLNPSGFFENYLFMEWSVFYMKLHGVNGASLEVPGAWNPISRVMADRSDFVRFCLLENPDDRISNRNKLRVLRKYSHENLDQYLQREFGEWPLVKNPHFSLFFPAMLRHWPQSRFLFAFQDPRKTLSSVNKKMLEVSPELYLRYYAPALEANDPRIGFVSLEQLLLKPESSLKALADWTGRSLNKNSLSILKMPLAHSEPEKMELPEKVLEAYAQLSQKAINRS